MGQETQIKNDHSSSSRLGEFTSEKKKFGLNKVFADADEAGEPYCRI